jgi:hypothetical protein
MPKSYYTTQRALAIKTYLCHDGVEIGNLLGFTHTNQQVTSEFFQARSQRHRQVQIVFPDNCLCLSVVMAPSRMICVFINLSFEVDTVIGYGVREHLLTPVNFDLFQTEKAFCFVWLGWGVSPHLLQPRCECVKSLVSLLELFLNLVKSEHININNNGVREKKTTQTTINHLKSRSKKPSPQTIRPPQIQTREIHSNFS